MLLILLFALLSTLLHPTASTPLTPSAPKPTPIIQPGPIRCATCDPHPPNNHCDPSTSCAVVDYSGKVARTYCACRGGFRGNITTANQWRVSVPGQEGRVFVVPGVVCNELCDDPYAGPGSCAEVRLDELC